jgi:hypothetical protein
VEQRFQEFDQSIQRSFRDRDGQLQELEQLYRRSISEKDGALQSLQQESKTRWAAIMNTVQEEVTLESDCKHAGTFCILSDVLWLSVSGNIAQKWLEASQ